MVMSIVEADPVQAILEGGPATIPHASRVRAVSPLDEKVKLPHYGGYEHFERTGRPSYRTPQNGRSSSAGPRGPRWRNSPGPLDSFLIRNTRVRSGKILVPLQATFAPSGSAKRGSHSSPQVVSVRKDKPSGLVGDELVVVVARPVLPTVVPQARIPLLTGHDI